MRKNDSAASERGAVSKSKYRSAAREIAYIALAVSLITVCAWITLPLGPIPFTLQTLAVALVGALLGWKRGVAAVAVYIFMGLIGIPVFSRFQATTALFGTTGGYIFGFLFLALGPALAKLLPIKNVWARAGIVYAGMVLGMVIMYFFGTVWYANLSGTGFVASLTVCVVPFILPDLVKFVISAFLAVKLEKYVR